VEERGTGCSNCPSAHTKLLSVSGSDGGEECMLGLLGLSTEECDAELAGCREEGREGLVQAGVEVEAVQS
jgi:hypothetical protein